MDAAAAQVFISYLEDQRLIVDYAYISAYALLYYDFIITFHQEVQLIWLGRWNYTKVLFLLARYIPIVDSYFWLHNQLGLNVDPNTCQPAYKAAAWLVLISISIAEVILIVRTWAVWNRKKIIGIPLGLLLCASVTTSSVFAKQYLDSIHVAPSPFPGFRGCLVLAGVSNVIFIDYVMVTVIDVVVLILMCISAFRSYRAGNSNNLSQVVHRDGIQFYIYLLPFTLANIIIMKTLRADLVTMITPLEGSVYSIFSCRIILNIRNAVGKNNAQVTELDTFAHERVAMTPMTPLPLHSALADRQNPREDEEDF